MDENLISWAHTLLNHVCTSTLSQWIKMKKCCCVLPIYQKHFNVIDMSVWWFICTYTKYFMLHNLKENSHTVFTYKSRYWQFCPFVWTYNILDIQAKWQTYRWFKNICTSSCWIRVVAHTGLHVHHGSKLNKESKRWCFYSKYMVCLCVFIAIFLILRINVAIRFIIAN